MKRFFTRLLNTLRHRDLYPLVMIIILSPIVIWGLREEERNRLAYPQEMPVITLNLRESAFQKDYSAEACVVCCIDDRFTIQLYDFFRVKLNSKFPMPSIDCIRVDGGAKDLFRSRKTIQDTYIQDYLINQIENSIKLHHARKVILIDHIDCRAYGGNKDEIFYIKELQRVKPEVEKLLKYRGHNIEVATYLAKFDGIYEVK